MRKLFLSIIALTLGIGAWAQETQTVNYIDTNYQQQTVTATVITNSSSILNAGWYVVLGNDVQTNTLTCNGAVNLILADGAKLTATGDGQGTPAPPVLGTPGIEVSGEGKSLVIYGQTAQTGQLFANGGFNCAGIGGGNSASGSNITINGGIITANGDLYGTGIGGGYCGSSSNIKVAAALTVYADNNNPPTTEIPHADDDDIAPDLANKQYAIVKYEVTSVKQDAIAAINAAIEGITNEDIIAIATNAKTAINAATSVETVHALRIQTLAAIASAKAAYDSGKAEAFGPLGTEQPGPAVKVTKGDKEVILYLPDKVEYIIRK